MFLSMWTISAKNANSDFESWFLIYSDLPAWLNAEIYTNSQGPSRVTIHKIYSLPYKCKMYTFKKIKDKSSQINTQKNKILG